MYVCVYQRSNTYIHSRPQHHLYSNISQKRPISILLTRILISTMSECDDDNAEKKLVFFFHVYG